MGGAEEEVTFLTTLVPHAVPFHLLRVEWGGGYVACLFEAPLSPWSTSHRFTVLSLS